MKTQTKSKMCKIACLCLTLFIMISCFVPTITHAEDDFSPFTVTGEYSKNFTITTNREEIFDISKGSPGDTISGEIVVKNNSSDKMEIAIADIKSNISDEALYEALELKIKCDGKTLYSGSYGDTPEYVTDFIPVKGKKSIVFDIEVYFPDYSDNTLQGKEMDATWEFEARYYKKERVKTGVDLSEYNNDGMFPFLIGLSALLVIISFILIIAIRHKEKKKKCKED